VGERIESAKKWNDGGTTQGNPSLLSCLSQMKMNRQIDPLSVAIIEDGSDIVDAISLGFSIGRPQTKIHHFHDGEEVVEFVGCSQPSIVVIDAYSNLASRLELIKSIRLVSKVPILVVSRDREISTQAMDLGAHDIIANPFNLSDLFMKTCSLINRA
jgi:two-component system KDP operon response regulator KdpE